MSQFYLNAAKAVKESRSGKSFKGHFASRNLDSSGTKEYAISAETLKFYDILSEVLVLSGVNSKTNDVQNKELFLVLLYELLFGKGIIKGGGSVKKILKENEVSLKLALSKIMKSKNVTEPKQLLSTEKQALTNIPRYLRINYAKSRDGNDLQNCIADRYPEIKRDFLITSLYELPYDSKGLHQFECVVNSEVIVQDKASCIPSQILFDEWRGCISRCVALNGCILDACSAPGNKTSHVASEVLHFLKESSLPLLNVNHMPLIIACEKDKKRFSLLCNRMHQALSFTSSSISSGSTAATSLIRDCDYVICVNENFLDLPVDDPVLSKVQYILLDPSCSGSGVTKALERSCSDGAVNDEIDTRLQQLQQFQVAVTKKAMSFPSVHTIVYSTCSIHSVENEDVISEILRWCKNSNDCEHLSDWKLSCPERFPMNKWSRRGVVSSAATELTNSDVEKLIRCSPEDGMNGFFVGLYVNEEKRRLLRINSKSYASNSLNRNDLLVNLRNEIPVKAVREKEKRSFVNVEGDDNDNNRKKVKAEVEKKAKLPKECLKNMWRPKFKR